MSDPSNAVVSVIIPAYKHRDFILQALDSVFAQTYPHYEVIVVNDGSPDDTEDVVRPLIEAGKIRYIAQANAGQSSARNRGIAESKGEFIALLDDDDLWPPDKLQWQVESLQSDPDAALVYGRAKVIDGEGNPFTPEPAMFRPANWLDNGPSGEVYEKFIERNHIVSPGLCLMRRSKLMSLDGPFDLSIQGGADDWDLFLMLSRQSPFLSVDRTALLYRMHSSNASGNLSRMWESALKVFHKHAAGEKDPVLKELWRRRVEEHRHWTVHYSLLALGDRSPNADNWTRADSWRWLRRFPRQTLRQSIERAILIARVGIGVARTRLSLALKSNGSSNP